MSSANYPLSRAIGEVIHAERTRLGWNTTELGSRVDPPLHWRTLATYEQGTRKIGIDTLEAVSAALGLDMIEIIRRARARRITT